MCAIVVLLPPTVVVQNYITKMVPEVHIKCLLSINIIKGNVKVQILGNR